MNGDLLKSASRVALVAVASVMVSGLAAQAADLGGNCCADLEERVAELEATTARKGNRKVSLTVYGHVNESVIFWNDGQEKNAYVVSNNAARSRFGFRGDAKVTSDVSLGYNLEIGATYASTSSRSQTAQGAGGGNNGNAAGISAPGPLDIRQSFWYIDSKSLGRVSVGKQNSAAESITEINLANINATAFDYRQTNGGFFLRNSGVKPSGITWGQMYSQLQANVGDGDRSNVVKYTSPTFAGFIASAAWGEDDRKDIALRYAGEFSGFRLAAGIGYQLINDFNPTADGGAACSNPGGAPASGLPGALVAQATISNTNCSALGLSASVMHVPTGIFLTGGYGQTKDKNINALAAANVSYTANNQTAANPYTGAALSDTNKHFHLMAGIEQKWFSLGKSTIYGEYSKETTGAGIVGGAGGTGQLRTVGADAILTAGGCTSSAGTFNTVGLPASCILAGNSTKSYGIGFNQEITAAAADMYISFRNTSGTLDIRTMGGAAVANTGPKDIQVITTGMVIRF
jgi:hypothetical protein